MNLSDYGIKFKLDFITNFCATWAANNYNDFCSRGLHDQLGKPPVEDAEHLAAEHWEELIKNKKIENLIQKDTKPENVMDFLNKDGEVKIIVNGKEFTTHPCALGFREIAKLAGKTSEINNLTITFHSKFKKGFITKNEEVFLNDGLIFNVLDTDNGIEPAKNITVNGKFLREFRTNLSYTDVVLLAGKSLSNVYTVTYHLGGRHEGSLVEGNSVFISDGMVFNCFDTSKT